MSGIGEWWNVESRLPEPVWSDDFSGQWMFHVTGWLQKDRFIGSPFCNASSAFSIDAAKERGDAVIVFLADLFERMMMASRAANSHSEKQLCGVVDVTVEITNLRVPLSRRIHADVSGCRHDSSDEVVVRNVFGNGVTDPAMKGDRARNSRLLASPFVSQNIGPFLSEVISVARIVEQPLDKLLSPRGRIVTCECL